MKKKRGILMPVFALPGKYGIGTFGKEAYDFVDFLVKSGQSVWQMLPLGQTTFGDSPYQTTYDRSLNPYFCDLDDLKNQGLLSDAELKTAEDKSGKINYGKLYKTRYSLLQKAFSRFDFSDDFLAVVNRKKFDDYALFASLKSVYGELTAFPQDIKNRKKSSLNNFRELHENEYLFHIFIQYTLEKQFLKLKKYANEKGVKFMGDLPLYVSADSADVWANPKQFALRENLAPKTVAGVPPDYFSADGQLWGNPVYDYEEMKKNNFSWWKKRIRFALSRYDLLRIDHFRGLDRFWAIPNGKSAKEGEWLPAYGREILKPFKNRLIAEDLGTIDDGVRSLLSETGYPGMKVLLFAYDQNPQNPYLPAFVGENSVVYVGTHDNDTAYGFAKTLDADAFKRFSKAVNDNSIVKDLKVKTKKDVAPVLIENAYATRSCLSVISYADVMNYDNRYRINTPSTVGNWTVKFKKSDFSDEKSNYLKALAEKYKRK